MTTGRSLDDLGFDFARVLVHQRFKGGLALDYGIADFFDTTGQRL